MMMSVVLSTMNVNMDHTETEGEGGKEILGIGVCNICESNFIQMEHFYYIC